MESNQQSAVLKEEAYKAVSPCKVLVIHARRFIDRKKYMDHMLQSHPYPFEYIWEGDADALSRDVLDMYFTDKEVERGIRMNVPRFLSCTLKHFLAYERIVAERLPGALILEDDAVLLKDFDSIFHQTMVEYESVYAAKCVVISYEDTRLRFVPRSQRRKGQYLYRGDRDRMAGAYFINRQAAQMILDEVKASKCHLPIDLYHRHLLNQGKLLYLWCQPAIASQGSHTGLFVSTLSQNRQWLKGFVWNCKLGYKKLLYNFR